MYRLFAIQDRDSNRDNILVADCFGVCENIERPLLLQETLWDACVRLCKMYSLALLVHWTIVVSHVGMLDSSCRYVIWPFSAQCHRYIGVLSRLGLLLRVECKRTWAGRFGY